MVVNIMTQFYGESEIIALAQHVTDVADKYLPKTTPVEVELVQLMEWRHSCCKICRRSLHLPYLD